MSLRPTQTRWFEILTSRDRTVWALDALAHSGLVQLEIDPRALERVEPAELRLRLLAHDETAKRYQAVWPEIEPGPQPLKRAPEQLLDNALKSIAVWEREAATLVEQLQSARVQHNNLQLLRELVTAVDEQELDLGLFSSRGGPIAVVFYAVVPERVPRRIPEGVITREYRTPHRSFFLAMGESVPILRLEAELAAKHAQRLQLPVWLGRDRPANLARINADAARLREEMSSLDARLDDINDKHRLTDALRDIALVRWYVEQAGQLSYKERFCRITGWTTDLDGAELKTVLAAAGLRGRLRFPPPPSRQVAPGRMRNPRWARPFEFLTGLFGQPSGAEVDPSRLLVFITPLLFGYMFPDVVHGVLIALAGLLLARRWPQAQLLVPCGAAAVVFGFVFGDVLGLPGIIAPLWVKPLDEPILILLVPVAAGALLLLFGLLLGGLQARWRGQLGAWMLLDAPIMLLFAGLFAGIVYRPALLVAAVAVLWYVLGSLYAAAAGHIDSLLAALGHWIERLAQLLVNTVSFVRVGAFALAHAGLSGAIIALAEMTEHRISYVLVMLIGTVITLVLEGLVVMVQAIRLIFFEFFLRFLHAEGREFKPLKASGRRDT